MVFLAIYCFIIVIIEIYWLKLPENTPVKNATLIHSLLGFVLSMLLVFRTNTAYERWWEGRKLWGTLTNSSRNLSIKLDALLPLENKNDRLFFAKSISLFSRILMNHLSSEDTRIMISDNEFEEINISKNCAHLPANSTSIIYNKLFLLRKNNFITEFDLLMLNEELKTFMEVCGGCERIKNTPIPFSYSLFIKKFIFFYIMTMPIGYCITIGLWSIPLVVFVFYIIASLEVIAEEIEDPFNHDSNDIPTENISNNIRKQVFSILKIEN